MAGAKKKKTKPVANPARGFATTSIASKLKAEKSTDIGNDASETSSVAAGSTSAPSEDVQAPQAATTTDSRELHELTPEELELQLERSELQIVVEQHGPKVRKESSRQINRLRTDRRVFRGQAEPLRVAEWLPDELMQQIVDFAMHEEQSVPPTETRADLSLRTAENVMLSRVWQLSVVLGDMDLSEDSVSRALHHVMSTSPAEEPSTSIWGLNEALEWLSLHCERGELLNYDASKPRVQAVVEPNLDEGKIHDYSSLFPFCRSFSLTRIVSDVNEARRTTTANQERATTSRPAVSTAGPGCTPKTPENDLDVSDVDSDLDPDEMLAIYMKTKTRLFDHSPDLVPEADFGGKRSVRDRQIQNKAARQATPGEAKLQQRLKNIESDPLFDQDTADAQWTAQKVDILKQHAERRRLNIEGDGARKTSEVAPRQVTNGASNSVLDEADELGKRFLEEAAMDQDDDVLGGMFDVPDDAKTRSVEQSDLQNPVSLITRNFGKLTGLSPRRVLEEACRSRRVQHPTMLSMSHETNA